MFAIVDLETVLYTRFVGTVTSCLHSQISHACFQWFISYCHLPCCFKLYRSKTNVNKDAYSSKQCYRTSFKFFKLDDMELVSLPPHKFGRSSAMLLSLMVRNCKLRRVSSNDIMFIPNSCENRPTDSKIRRDTHTHRKHDGLKSLHFISFKEGKEAKSRLK
jgi:hypothetical protein